VGGVAHPLDAVVVAVPDEDCTVPGGDQHFPVPVFRVILVQNQVHVVGTLVSTDADHVLDFVASSLEFLEFLFGLDVHSELTYFSRVRHNFLGIVVETAPLLDLLVVDLVEELHTVVTGPNLYL